MDGIRKARDKGVEFGRKPALNALQQRQILHLSRDEGMSLNQIADKYAVSHMTVYRVLKKELEAVPEPEACGMGHEERPTTYSSYG